MEFGGHFFRETFLKSDVWLITMKPSSWLCRQPPSVRVNKAWVCFKLERSGHPLFWGLLLDLQVLYSFQFCPYQVMGVQCELYIYISIVMGAHFQILWLYSVTPIEITTTAPPLIDGNHVSWLVIHLPMNNPQLMTHLMVREPYWWDRIILSVTAPLQKLITFNTPYCTP